MSAISPAALVLLSVLCVQLGSALATLLFFDLGPAGTALTSTGFAALALTLISRPNFDGRIRHRLGSIVLFGLVNACMVLTAFLALERIPLGMVATISFLGPLSVAVLSSRRLMQFVGIGVAVLGVGLVTPAIGTDLDRLGLCYAGLSALAWAAFVPLSKQSGQDFNGSDGLTFALWVASLLLIPFAIIEGRIAHAGLFEIAGALGVALLGYVLPTVLEFSALQRMSARAYGVLVTSEPAMGALVGAVALGQAIHPRMTAAIACVTMAALTIMLAERQDP